MHILKTILLLLITTSTSFAETNTPSSDLLEYDVEVIIFEDTKARYINNEAWDQNIQTPVSGNINAVAFTNRKPTILKHEYKRVKNSSEYEVLFYGSWRQTGLKETNAFEIDLRKLKNAHKNKSKNTISGQLKVVLARYLHFYGDLVYQRDLVDVIPLAIEEISAESKASDETVPGIKNQSAPTKKEYRITMHRRMRSKELHYIDHPLVGVLIKINPVKKAKDN